MLSGSQDLVTGNVPNSEFSEWREAGVVVRGGGFFVVLVWFVFVVFFFEGGR